MLAPDRDESVSYDTFDLVNEQDDASETLQQISEISHDRISSDIRNSSFSSSDYSMLGQQRIVVRDQTDRDQNLPPQKLQTPFC